MRELHQHIVRWFLPLVLFCLAGCQDFGQYGSWTGVVNPIHIVPQNAEPFDIAGINIEKGPQFDLGRYPENYVTRIGGPEALRNRLDGGTNPVLVHGPYAVGAFLAQDMPVGKRITVQGWMDLLYFGAPENLHDVHSFRMSTRNKGHDSQNSLLEDHVLIIDRYRVEGQSDWTYVPQQTYWDSMWYVSINHLRK